MPLSKRVCCSDLPSTPQSVGRARPLRAGVVTGDPVCVSRGREKSRVPSGSGTRTYSVDWGQRRRLRPVSDPLRSSFRDYSWRRGGAQVNRPAPIRAGDGGSPPLETLVRLPQGIWWFGHGLKGGATLDPLDSSNSC